MKPRWPLKQTVPIQWSAPTWRPQINFGASNQPERPGTIRVLRPQQAMIEQCENDGESGRMWI